jgi:hypothetical protein
MRTRLVELFCTHLDLSVKRKWAIATLLHPTFKDWTFKGTTQAEKEWALAELQSEWISEWKFKGFREEAQAPQAPRLCHAEENTPSLDDGDEGTGVTITQRTLKHRKISVASILAPAVQPAAPQQIDEKDELDLYLASPSELDPDLDIQAWWKLATSKWPKLTLMARQFHAIPASSGGVERVFSKCTKAVSSLRENMKDTSLQNSILVAYNTP